MRKGFFNELAERWDQLAAPDAPEKLASILGWAGLKKGSRVLDVGCGTGSLIPAVLEAVGNTGHITGVDFAEKMIVRALARQLGPQVQFAVADVAALPFLAGVFDAVVCTNAFPHFPDKAAALREMGRVTKSDGILLICHTQSREAVNAMHRQIGGPVGNDLIPDVEELKTLLNASGYEVEDLLDEPDCFAVKAWCC